MCSCHLLLSEYGEIFFNKKRNIFKKNVLDANIVKMLQLSKLKQLLIELIEKESHNEESIMYC